jgi:hypothetical protein
MIPDFETWRTASPETRRLCFSQSPNLQVSPSGTAVLNVGLTALAGSVLQSRPFHLTPAMNPFSRPNRPIFPQGTAFRPGMALFPRKTAAPFRPGCSMNASGWLLRRPGWPMSSAGCSTARSWTQVRQPGRSISGAGWSISHSGRLPISRRENPGAFMEDPAASMAHPGSASEHPATASGHPKTNFTQPQTAKP